MKIISINAMRGPNYWSVRRHKLIVMVLDLEEMEELPSNREADQRVMHNTFIRKAEAGKLSRKDMVEFIVAVTATSGNTLRTTNAMIDRWGMITGTRNQATSVDNL